MTTDPELLDQAGSFIASVDFGRAWDGPFIAASRQDVPKLLSLVRFLEGQMGDLKQDRAAYLLGVADGRKQGIDETVEVFKALFWRRLRGMPDVRLV